MISRTPVSNAPSKVHALDQGREAFRKQAWEAAFSQLAAADQDVPLDPEALVEFAQSALLTGREEEGADLLARAHQGFLSLQQITHAARCAFWLGFTALINGEFAKAGGWLSRAGRLLEGQPDCVEKGYLMLPAGYRSFHEGDAPSAHALFVKATAVGQLFRDKDLLTLGLQGQGRALIRQGEISKGVTLLDEAMVGVTAGECSPLTAGGVYCSVIEACGEIFDLRRAQEWTSALERWCASQPDLVPYRGHCLVRRAELLRLHGAWPDALEEAQKACEWLSRPGPKPTVGAAFYQAAEVYRVRGEFSQAEENYRQANQWHRAPQPGLALMRLAQGQVESASSAIRRIVEEAQTPDVLDAYVEIMLAVGDVPAARSAADKLTTISQQNGAPLLHAMSSRATGGVLLAEGDARSALLKLRDSWTTWCELEAPYEAARVQTLIALACRALGDEDAAASEIAAARNAFQKLGAVVELSRLEAQSLKPKRPTAGSLTAREIEVLRLVASGMTNRAIATTLRISEKTVARHLSNIFNKLDLSSRSAATAYAFQNDLI